MNNSTSVQLQSPYLLFIGEVDDTSYAKTALGVCQWCPELVAGQLRFAGNTLNLGVADMTLEQSVQAGVKSLLIGVAPVGGIISGEWEDVIRQAAGLGLNIISGLHTPLHTIDGLSEIAKKSGSTLVDVRIPPDNIPVGNGQKRSGMRLLTVGTDCAVGKKYTALAIANNLKQMGVNADFRATGQTGIMISGRGIPVDSVVSDFVSGAAEIISPPNSSDHWDVIEGQGSLFNASYAGVSLGLLHGSQPDAIVVCHDAGREFVVSCEGHRLPGIQACIDLNLSCARLTNPAVRCLGVSINTSSIPDNKRQEYLQRLSQELSLPCFDPLLDGCHAVTAAIAEQNREMQVLSYE